MSQNPGGPVHQFTGKPDVNPNKNDADWSELEMKSSPKTWKDNQFVPIGIFGAAVGLAAFLVMKGKGDGRQLGQRIMEARVAAQATLLGGVCLAGWALSSSNTKKSSMPDRD